MATAVFAQINLIGVGIILHLQKHISLSANASRKHDVPSATSDFPSATSSPNGGGDYACVDAEEPSSPA